MIPYMDGFPANSIGDVDNYGEWLRMIDREALETVVTHRVAYFPHEAGLVAPTEPLVQPYTDLAMGVVRDVTAAWPTEVLRDFVSSTEPISLHYVIRFNDQLPYSSGT